MKFLNVSLNDVKNNFIVPLNRSIENYGIDNYENNLNAKINQKTLRILQNEGLKEKKVADKSIDEKFHNLLGSSNNTNNFIKNYENFDNFEKKMERYLKNLSLGYDNSKNTINNNEYEEEISLLLKNKLEFLNNLSLDYYNQINEKYLQLKTLLKSSIEEIDNLLNKCANKTFSVFVDKYNEISNSTQNKNITQVEQVEESNFNFTKNYENKNYISSVFMKNLNKEANFKFEFNFDEINNLKMPKVYAHIINLSRPKQLIMDIYEELIGIHKYGTKYEVNFNDANFTLILDFNTESDDIKLNVITNFEKYQYFIKKYILKEVENKRDCDKYICPYNSSKTIIEEILKNDSIIIPEYIKNQNHIKTIQELL